MSNFEYLSGFGNEFASEALPNTLPKGQNTPQKVKHGLYAEQISGTAFTAPREENKRTWCYRIRPSVIQGEYKQVDNLSLRSAPFNEVPPSPNQMRWSAHPFPQQQTDFIDGLITIGGNGSVDSQVGLALHTYVANVSMTERFFYNSDGDFLIVPQQGVLLMHTELGSMDVRPGEICVVPRGIRFQVAIEGESRGYVCENYGPAFRLPCLGVVGANGLANPRDFLTPVARYEKREGEFRLTNKYLGNLWEAPIPHSPLDVVAWHGNYVPYKYDLQNFQAINAVNFDHPDPCIFTVLTCPSSTPGTANIDFVVFPSRWLVAEHTFRPPYFHRNYMSEFMGLIEGIYDGKAEGFVPGGFSLHNRMTPHGPDAKTFEKASNAELKPVYLEGTLAFMFESFLPYRLTKQVYESTLRQKNYLDCWQDIKANFSPEN